MPLPAPAQGLPLERIRLPPGFEVMRDGSLLVSDDHAGAIYRTRYRGK